MNDFPDKLEPQDDLAKPTLVRAAASIVLLLIGASAIVGTCILFFYLKAFHVEPFRGAWRHDLGSKLVPAHRTSHRDRPRPPERVLSRTRSISSAKPHRST